MKLNEQHGTISGNIHFTQQALLLSDIFSEGTEDFRQHISHSVSSGTFCGKTLNCGKNCTVHFVCSHISMTCSNNSFGRIMISQGKHLILCTAPCHSPAVRSHAQHSHRRFLCLNESVTSNTNSTNITTWKKKRHCSCLPQVKTEFMTHISKVWCIFSKQSITCLLGQTPGGFTSKTIFSSVTASHQQISFSQCLCCVTASWDDCGHHVPKDSEIICLHFFSLLQLTAISINYGGRLYLDSVKGGGSGDALFRTYESGTLIQVHEDALCMLIYWQHDYNSRDSSTHHRYNNQVQTVRSSLRPLCLYLSTKNIKEPRGVLCSGRLWWGCLTLRHLTILYRLPPPPRGRAAEEQIICNSNCLAAEKAFTQTETIKPDEQLSHICLSSVISPDGTECCSVRAPSERLKTKDQREDPAAARVSMCFN